MGEGRFGGRASERAGSRDLASDAQWGNTSTSTFSRMANAARSEKHAEARGDNYKVFKFFKNGTSKPFVNDWFSEERANEQKAYWEKLNPGTKFEVRKMR
jgi:hypothetical protein